MSTAKLSSPLITNSEVIHKRVANTKQRVCTIAAELFNRDGYGNVSIETILAQADIARSTFYRFFKDKDDLLVNIINPMFYHARETLEQIDHSKPELIVNGIGESFLDIWRRQKEALVFSTQINESQFPLVEEAHNAYADVIQSLMRELHQCRMLRNDDPLLSAVLLAQTAVKILSVCERHPQFDNVYLSTLRGLLLKW